MIYGIRIEIGSRRVRRVIREVLDRIRAQSPSDFERLKETVETVRWLREEDTRDEAPSDLIVTGRFMREDQHYVIGFEKRMPGYCLKAVIAHEFGHACTRHIQDLDNESREYLADRFARQWGFGKEIDYHRTLNEFALSTQRKGGAGL